MTLSKHLSIFSLFTLITVFSVGCSKDDEPAPDTTAPEIIITSPEDGDVIDIPGPVTVTGEIVEAGELVRLEVTLSAGPLFPPVTETLMKGDPGFPTKSGNKYIINMTENIDEAPPFRLSVDIDIEAEDAAGNIGSESLTISLE
jgi:hypothetical protein